MNAFACMSKPLVLVADGVPYLYLLKGKEDLRQDERVMQLFGLINALLQEERPTARVNLSIRRFAVMPLSNNSGLIGWVPNCDTMHKLIKQYRHSKASVPCPCLTNYS